VCMCYFRKSTNDSIDRVWGWMRGRDSRWKDGRSFGRRSGRVVLVRCYSYLAPGTCIAGASAVIIDRPPNGNINITTLV
jgi:hypothetical protein